MVPRYEETVRFHPVVEISYLGGIGFFVGAHLYAWPRIVWGAVLLGSALLVFLPAMFGRLVIQVDDEAVEARFGFLGWPRQRVPLSQIEKARVVSYRPLLQFGGWGIRAGKLEGELTGVYSVRGNRGALLELAEPRRVCIVQAKRFLLGSREPERLVAAIGKP